MNYSLELSKLQKMQEELIKKAEKEGYVYVVDKLVKQSYIPVAELYIRAQTSYESYGSFYVVKKTIALNNEQLNEVKSLKITKENLVDFIHDGFLNEMKDETLNSFYEALLLYGGIEEDNINYYVEEENLSDEYSCLNEGQNLYLEFSFNDDEIDGYVSIYDMSIEDYTKKEDIDLYFRKYLTLN